MLPAMSQLDRAADDRRFAMGTTSLTMAPDGAVTAIHHPRRNHLASFGPDGSASCAFVYPSCVNGQPAHVADPLANDQDWALVYALRYGLGPPD